MDASTTGHFIAELRKEKGYTQKELADKLMVSDKAVSRWETGKGFPDTALLKPLADTLGVSVGELLSGEHMVETKMKEQTDRVILEALSYSGRMLIGMINLILILIGTALLLSPLFLAGSSYWLVGLVLLGIALARICFKRGGKSMKGKEKIFHVAEVVFLLAALVLEALPFGAVLVFAPSPTERIAETYSYFDFMLIGYGNFAPMLTGLLTAASVLLALTTLWSHQKGSKCKNAAFVCGVLAAVLSLLPLLLFGGEYMTEVSYLITAFIVISLCLQAVVNRKDRQKV